MKRFTFTVPGKPVGKMRHRSFTRGKFTSTYTPKPTVEYEKRVKQCAIDAGVELMERVEVNLLIVIPCRWKRYKTKPDILLEPLSRSDDDNIEKSIKDALKGVAYKDDKHSLSGYKRFGFSKRGDCYVKVVLKEVKWENYIID